MSELMSELQNFHPYRNIPMYLNWLNFKLKWQKKDIRS